MTHPMTQAARRNRVSGNEAASHESPDGNDACENMSGVRGKTSCTDCKIAVNKG